MKPSERIKQLEEENRQLKLQIYEMRLEINGLKQQNAEARYEVEEKERETFLDKAARNRGLRLDSFNPDDMTA